MTVKQIVSYFNFKSAIMLIKPINQKRHNSSYLLFNTQGVNIFEILKFNRLIIKKKLLKLYNSREQKRIFSNI